MTGTAVAIIVRVPENYPWWYTAWTAVTGGTATGTIAWLTAFTYTAYEEPNIMVLSNIVRERDRKAAEARQQEMDAQQQELDAQQQELDTQQQELDTQQQELSEREEALQKLAEHLPPQYRAEFERLAGNGKEPEDEQQPPE